MTFEELMENFELLESWEERYRYLIDLGKKLPPFPEEEKTQENFVKGCMSQVWFKFLPQEETPPRIRFIADSDAHIVKGLAAVLRTLFEGKTPEEARAVDLDGIFERLGLANHLSMNRRNGFYAMAQKIREANI